MIQHTYVNPRALHVICSLIHKQLRAKVDKTDGKVLSEIDFTDAERNKLANMQEDLTGHPTFNGLNLTGTLNAVDFQ